MLFFIAEMVTGSKETPGSQGAISRAVGVFTRPGNEDESAVLSSYVGRLGENPPGNGVLGGGSFLSGILHI